MVDEQTNFASFIDIEIHDHLKNPEELDALLQVHGQGDDFMRHLDVRGGHDHVRISIDFHCVFSFLATEEAPISGGFLITQHLAGWLRRRCLLGFLADQLELDLLRPDRERSRVPGAEVDVALRLAAHHVGDGADLVLALDPDLVALLDARLVLADEQAARILRIDGLHLLLPVVCPNYGWVVPGSGMLPTPQATRLGVAEGLQLTDVSDAGDLDDGTHEVWALAHIATFESVGESQERPHPAERFLLGRPQTVALVHSAAEYEADLWRPKVDFRHPVSREVQLDIQALSFTFTDCLVGLLLGDLVHLPERPLLSAVEEEVSQNGHRLPLDADDADDFLAVTERVLVDLGDGVTFTVSGDTKLCLTGAAVDITDAVPHHERSHVTSFQRLKPTSVGGRSLLLGTVGVDGEVLAQTERTGLVMLHAELGRRQVQLNPQPTPGLDQGGEAELVEVARLVRFPQLGSGALADVVDAASADGESGLADHIPDAGSVHVGLHLLLPPVRSNFGGFVPEGPERIGFGDDEEPLLRLVTLRTLDIGPSSLQPLGDAVQVHGGEIAPTQLLPVLVVPATVVNEVVATHLTTAEPEGFTSLTGDVAATVKLATEHSFHELHVFDASFQQVKPHLSVGSTLSTWNPLWTPIVSLWVERPHLIEVLVFFQSTAPLDILPSTTKNLDNIDICIEGGVGEATARLLISLWQVEFVELHAIDLPSPLIRGIGNSHERTACATAEPMQHVFTSFQQVKPHLSVGSTLSDVGDDPNILSLVVGCPEAMNLPQGADIIVGLDDHIGAVTQPEADATVRQVHTLEDGEMAFHDVPLPPALWVDGDGRCSDLGPLIPVAHRALLSTEEAPISGGSLITAVQLLRGGLLGLRDRPHRLGLLVRDLLGGDRHRARATEDQVDVALLHRAHDVRALPGALVRVALDENEVTDRDLLGVVADEEAARILRIDRLGHDSTPFGLCEPTLGGTLALEDNPPTPQAHRLGWAEELRQEAGVAPLAFVAGHVVQGLIVPNLVVLPALGAERCLHRCGAGDVLVVLPSTTPLNAGDGIEPVEEVPGRCRGLVVQGRPVIVVRGQLELLEVQTGEIGLVADGHVGTGPAATVLEQHVFTSFQHHKPHLAVGHGALHVAQDVLDDGEPLIDHARVEPESLLVGIDRQQPDAALLPLVVPAGRRDGVTHQPRVGVELQAHRFRCLVVDELDRDTVIGAMLDQQSMHCVLPPFNSPSPHLWGLGQLLQRDGSTTGVVHPDARVETLRLHLVEGDEPLFVLLEEFLNLGHDAQEPRHLGPVRRAQVDLQGRTEPLGLLGIEDHLDLPVQLVLDLHNILAVVALQNRNLRHVFTSFGDGLQQVKPPLSRGRHLVLDGFGVEDAAEEHVAGPQVPEGTEHHQRLVLRLEEARNEAVPVEADLATGSVDVLQGNLALVCNVPEHGLDDVTGHDASPLCTGTDDPAVLQHLKPVLSDGLGALRVGDGAVLPPRREEDLLLLQTQDHAVETHPRDTVQLALERHLGVDVEGDDDDLVPVRLPQCVVGGDLRHRRVGVVHHDRGVAARIHVVHEAEQTLRVGLGELGRDELVLAPLVDHPVVSGAGVANPTGLEVLPDPTGLQEERLPAALSTSENDDHVFVTPCVGIDLSQQTKPTLAGGQRPSQLYVERLHRVDGTGGVPVDERDEARITEPLVVGSKPPKVERLDEGAVRLEDVEFDWRWVEWTTLPLSRLPRQRDDGVLGLDAIQDDVHRHVFTSFQQVKLTLSGERHLLFAGDPTPGDELVAVTVGIEPHVSVLGLPGVEIDGDGSVVEIEHRQHVHSFGECNQVPLVEAGWDLVIGPDQGEDLVLNRGFGHVFTSFQQVKPHLPVGSTLLRLDDDGFSEVDLRVAGVGDADEPLVIQRSPPSGIESDVFHTVDGDDDAPLTADVGLVLPDRDAGVKDDPFTPPLEDDLVVVLSDKLHVWFSSLRHLKPTLSGEPGVSAGVGFHPCGVDDDPGFTTRLPWFVGGHGFTLHQPPLTVASFVLDKHPGRALRHQGISGGSLVERDVLGDDDLIALLERHVFTSLRHLKPTLSGEPEGSADATAAVHPGVAVDEHADRSAGPGGQTLHVEQVAAAVLHLHLLDLHLDGVHGAASLHLHVDGMRHRGEEGQHQGSAVDLLRDLQDGHVWFLQHLKPTLSGGPGALLHQRQNEHEEHGEREEADESGLLVPGERLPTRHAQTIDRVGANLTAAWTGHLLTSFQHHKPTLSGGPGALRRPLLLGLDFPHLHADLDRPHPLQADHRPGVELRPLRPPLAPGPVDADRLVLLEGPHVVEGEGIASLDRELHVCASFRQVKPPLSRCFTVPASSTRRGSSGPLSGSRVRRGPVDQRETGEEDLDLGLSSSSAACSTGGLLLQPPRRLPGPGVSRDP